MLVWAVAPEQWLLSVVLRRESAALPGNLLEKHILGPCPDLLNQKCCFHRSSGDSDVCSNFRSTDLGQTLASSARMIEHLRLCTSTLVESRILLTADRSCPHIQGTLKTQSALFLFPCSQPLMGCQ